MTTVIKNIRLRDVAEVRLVPRTDIVGGTDMGLTLRPDTVEIARGFGCVKVTMYQRFDHATGIFWDEPVLVGVLESDDDDLTVVDAFSNDGLAWEIIAPDRLNANAAPRWKMIIRPYADETIRVDSPKAADMPRELADLYADLRDVRDQLVINRRCRARRRGRGAKLSDTIAAMFRGDIAALEKEIAARTAASPEDASRDGEGAD